MERSASICPRVQWINRIIWNLRRTNEFARNIFAGHATLQFLQRHRLDNERTFHRMFFSNSDKVKNYKRRFQHGPWSFFGLGEEETWYGTHTYKPEGQWNATVMVDNCKDSGPSSIPSFQCVGSVSLSKREVSDVRFTSVRNLPMQSFHFTQFSLQISSVSREQWRIGVTN